MASSGKGAKSSGSGVKTSYLIFQKTDCGGTDKVWFYDMKADGYTLDAKRTPIDDNDIPDIINRYENLENEINNPRTAQSFMVDVEEIRKNDYDLTVNKYKEIIKEEKTYRKTSEIFNELSDVQNKMLEDIKALKGMLGD
jgi:type I restriction enzyme M protein